MLSALVCWFIEATSELLRLVFLMDGLGYQRCTAPATSFMPRKWMQFICKWLSHSRKLQTCIVTEWWITQKRDNTAEFFHDILEASNNTLRKHNYSYQSIMQNVLQNKKLATIESGLFSPETKSEMFNLRTGDLSRKPDQAAVKL